MSSHPISQNPKSIQPIDLPSQQQVSFLFTKLYESRQYFSPHQMSTEEEIIDQINSLGDQILYFEEESVIMQHEQQISSIIGQKGYHASLERNQKGIKEQIKKNNNIVNPAKEKEKRQKQALINTLKNSTTIKNNNLQTKQFTQTNKGKTSSNQTKILQKHQYLHPSKLQAQILQKKPKQVQEKTTKYIVQSKKILKPYKFEQNNDYDYKKFLQNSVQKIVREMKHEKELLKPHNPHTMRKAKYNDTSIKTQSNNQVSTSSHLLTISRQKIPKTSSILQTNSKAMLLRKEQKISSYKEQKMRKQMEEVTFQPKTYTKKYKSTNSYVKPNPSLNNFYERQRINQQVRTRNQFRKLEEVMEECPFRPRLNVNSKDANSLVKEMWRSATQSRSRSREESIQRSFHYQATGKGHQANNYQNLKLPRQKFSIKQNSTNHQNSKIDMNHFHHRSVQQVSISNKDELSFLLLSSGFQK